MLTDIPHVIVTGGCGFIGSHLTKHLLDQGFCVTVVDDNRTGNVFLNHNSVEYHKCDVVDFNPHQNSIEPPTAIFHLANSPRVRRALEYPTETIVNNIGTTCTVADWARIFNCKLFFSTSSSTQVVCESVLDMYRRLYSLDYVLMFYYNVYGPGEADYGQYSTVIRKFKQDYLAGRPLTIYGTGKKERDFTHVDDVIQGMLQLMADPTTPSVAHFGSGAPKTISSIADCFKHPIVHTFDRKGEAEKTFCEAPYIEPTYNVHEYIKNWVQENKSGTKNSSR